MLLLSIWIRPLLILVTPPIVIWLAIRRPNLRRLAWGAWLLLAFIGCYPIFVIVIATDHQPEAGVMMASAGDVPYAAIINAAAAEYRVDAALVAAVISVESGFNPDAVSSAGAMGLMQLMPETAREMGVDNPFDPKQNITGGVRYLAWLLDYYGGDRDKAIMAYHGGARTVDNGPRPVDREYLQMVKAALPGDCTWHPLYQTAAVTQGPHGQSYGHYAIDLSAGRGAVVYAPISGQAVATGDGYGNTVLTIENDCYVVTLLHGDWTIATVRVRAGDVIGTESNHGYTLDFFGNQCNGPTCGNHTHINVYDKNKQSNIDPRGLGLVR